jgi:hypothetical protein
MSDTATHLVDRVLPRVPVRQWVLSIPPPLRYLLAWDTELCAATARIFMRAVHRHLGRAAKREGIVRRAREAQFGAVCEVQRWGGSVNLNIHLHALVADGVFVAQPEPKPQSSAVSFRALPAPSHGELNAVAWEVCERVVRLLQKRGQWIDAPAEDDRLAEREPLLSRLYAASIAGTLVLGERAGQRQLRLYGAAARPLDDDGKVRNAYGFNLHAGVRVSAHDRAGLERLARYVTRPPLSKQRLTRQADGRYRIALKMAWRDGTSHIVLDGPELVGRLAALVPPPRFHLTRYYGVFAPRAKLRRAVVPGCDNETQRDADESPCHLGEAANLQSAPAQRRRLTWAKLLSRVFSVDVLACPKCSSEMQRVEVCTNAERIREVLAGIAAATGPPLEAPAA